MIGAEFGPLGQWGVFDWPCKFVMGTGCKPKEVLHEAILGDFGSQFVYSGFFWVPGPDHKRPSCFRNDHRPGYGSERSRSSKHAGPRSEHCEGRVPDNG